MLFQKITAYVLRQAPHRHLQTRNMIPTSCLYVYPQVHGILTSM